MSFLTPILLIYILSGIIALIMVWIFITEMRIKKFFAGTKASNLEDVLIQVNKQMGELKETQREINSHLVTVDHRLSKSIRKVESMRFNPFDDAGSNQSFAVALINDEGDGMVMSSLYARDRMSVFVKPIVNGKSEFELSHEEALVLEKAK
ncbi:MAG: DUF4446 family protein [bacterium]